MNVQLIHLTREQALKIAALCERHPRDTNLHLSKTGVDGTVRVEFFFPLAYNVAPDGVAQNVSA